MRLTLLKGKKKKVGTAKTTRKSDHIRATDFELPDLTERLEQMLDEIKALDNAYLERKSDDFYYVFNHGGRACLTCNKTHRSSNGRITICNEEAIYRCFKSPTKRHSLGSVKEEISKFEDEQVVAALKASEQFRKALHNLPWVAALQGPELEKYCNGLVVRFRNNNLQVPIAIPKGVTCPICKQTHKTLNLSVSRSQLRASGSAGKRTRTRLRRLASLRICQHAA